MTAGFGPDRLERYCCHQGRCPEGIRTPKTYERLDVHTRALRTDSVGHPGPPSKTTGTFLDSAAFRAATAAMQHQGERSVSSEAYVRSDATQYMGRPGLWKASASNSAGDAAGGDISDPCRAGEARSGK